MSGPENKGLTYRGRPVEELTKEELIYAMYHYSQMIFDLRRLHEDYVAHQARMREMR